MFSCVTNGTNIALYADDTKIWRQITCYEDHFKLQSDIDKLFAWSIKNKMKFHPSKCKVLSVTMTKNILDILPFNIFWYNLNNDDIDYMPSHKDLSVMLTSKLLWAEHCNQLVSNANSKIGLLMRTCHFATNKQQKRVFYLTIVRSIFEHGSIIWSPQGLTQLLKFESIQKRAVKWINGESFVSYSDQKFLQKQKELLILPIRLKFIHNSIMLFNKIINCLVAISLPDYITLIRPETMRYTRETAEVIDKQDTRTFSCAITPSCNSFKHSFFYRSMSLWNKLPYSIRQIDKISVFKHELTEFL